MANVILHRSVRLGRPMASAVGRSWPPGDAAIRVFPARRGRLRLRLWIVAGAVAVISFFATMLVMRLG